MNAPAILARLAALFPGDANQASLKFQGIGTLVRLSVKRRSRSDFRLQFNESDARFNVRLRDPAAFCAKTGQVLSRYGHLPPIARADAEQKFLAAKTNRFTRFFARIAVHLDPSHGSTILESVELLNEKKHRVWIDVRQRADVTFLTVGARSTSTGPRPSVHAFVEIAALQAFHTKLVSLRTASPPNKRVNSSGCRAQPCGAEHPAPSAPSPRERGEGWGEGESQD